MHRASCITLMQNAEDSSATLVHIGKNALIFNARNFQFLKSLRSPPPGKCLLPAHIELQIGNSDCRLEMPTLKADPISKLMPPRFLLPAVAAEPIVIPKETIDDQSSSLHHDIPSQTRNRLELATPSAG